MAESARALQLFSDNRTAGIYDEVEVYHVLATLMLIFPSRSNFRPLHCIAVVTLRKVLIIAVPT